jgi:hypothetical protein
MLLYWIDGESFVGRHATQRSGLWLSLSAVTPNDSPQLN